MRINKSAGLNESEHRLVKLGEKVFMGLWSYPNPKIKTSSGTPELCDLLVVCGNNVLVFSDKDIKFNEDKDLLVAWRRWERKAILKSINQLRHAENIIKDHPEKILLNDTDPFPLSFPAKRDLKIHLICVANGVAEACKKYFGKGCTGSLKFSNLDTYTQVSDKELSKLPVKEREEYKESTIFTITDYDLSKTFVHVFDDYSFPFVLQELDTLTDFVKYLEEKERFIRSGVAVCYTGEEDLLYNYLKEFDEERNCHTFVNPKETNANVFMFMEEDWDSFKQSQQYIARIQANQKSYFWDQLVQHNAQCTLAGITKIFSTASADCDIAFRYMALEDRLSRRAFSDRMIAAISSFPDNYTPDNHYMSAFFSFVNEGLLYIFLQIPKEGNSSHGEYLKARRDKMQIYANCAKARCEIEGKFVDKVICIATEPMRIIKNVDIDIMLMDIKEWNTELQEHWESVRRNLNIFRKSFKDLPHAKEKEWPENPIVNQKTTRKVGQNEKCPCGSGLKYKKCCGSVLKPKKQIPFA
ncbi:hypothetical protein HDR61_05210 [bacterium]|nr:hypothetical protein [bacterium]